MSFVRNHRGLRMRTTGAGGLLAVRASVFIWGSASDRSAPFGLNGPTYPVAPGNAPTSLLDCARSSGRAAFRQKMEMDHA